MDLESRAFSRSAFFITFFKKSAAGWLLVAQLHGLAFASTARASGIGLFEQMSNEDIASPSSCLAGVIRQTKYR